MASKLTLLWLLNTFLSAIHVSIHRYTSIYPTHTSIHIWCCKLRLATRVPACSELLSGRHPTVETLHSAPLLCLPLHISTHSRHRDQPSIPPPARRHRRDILSININLFLPPASRGSRLPYNTASCVLIHDTATLVLYRVIELA